MHHEPCRCEIVEIGLIISHPFGTDNGGIRTTLKEWMEIGPGPRYNTYPIKAFCNKCGADLDINIIPIQYRNSKESRKLIEKGNIKNPWK